MIWSVAVLLWAHGIILYAFVDRLVTMRVTANLDHERWQRRYDMDTLLLDLALVLEDAGVEKRLREAVREVMRRRCFSHPEWMTRSLAADKATRRDSTLEYRRSELWWDIAQQFPMSLKLKSDSLSEEMVGTWRQAEAEVEEAEAHAKKDQAKGQ